MAEEGWARWLDAPRLNRGLRGGPDPRQLLLVLASPARITGCRALFRPVSTEAALAAWDAASILVMIVVGFFAPVLERQIPVPPGASPGG